MELEATTISALARGCAVLGAGGGGDTHIGELMVLQAIGDHGPVPLVDLDDLPDDGLLMPCGSIGAPTVSIEKIENGDEGFRLREQLEALWGREVVAVMASEIGGSNGLLPIVWAARLGLPFVDADAMGRAFPEVQMVTMELAGISPGPGVMTDERGNVIVFRTSDGKWLERLARSACIEFGGTAASTEYVLTVAQARTATVRRSISFAIRIGRALLDAEDDPVGALVAELGAYRLIDGKITDVDRRITKGFVMGSVVVEGLRERQGRLLRLEIQNENLAALEEGRVLATVPDIISVLDTESAHAIATERLRYGQRVTVIAFPCDPIWRTERGLATAGPSAFGYDFDYRPVEELVGA